MPEQQRRAPPSMPAGATTLSERIAALQRKASDSQHRTASPHMVRASSANSSSSSATSPAWAPSSTRFSQPPQAVKDRIARFQPSAADLSERPLVPRSSFGAPAPNPDNSGRVLRPYPGASIPGGGSGNWGEGVLRPQMTGSAWLGTGGGPRSPGLKPQMTGPNWSRRQTSTPESLLIPTMQRHINGRDAFQDLDPERPGSPHSPRSLAFQASDVASQAAAMKGLTLASPVESQSSASSSSGHAASPFHLSTLSSLPDDPTANVCVHGAEASLSSTDAFEQGPKGNGREERSLPSPPATIPQSPRMDGYTSTAAETSIEIGVAGASVAELERLKAKAQASSGAANASVSGLGEAPSPTSKELVREVQSQSQTDGSIGFVTRTSVSPCPPAVAVLKPNGSSSVHDEAEPCLADAHYSVHFERKQGQSLSKDSAVGQAGLPETTSEAAAPAPATPIETVDQTALTGALLGAAGSPPLNSLTSLSMHANSATLAMPPKQVSAPDRKSKSQSMRRPAPGRIMSVAELDASDDEYEPGWASVISSSRS